MTPEEALQLKLESIRDSVIGFKYVTDSLVERNNETESDLRNLNDRVSRIDNNSIRTDERIANIERYIDAMRGDIRAVRNSVVGAIIGATIIGLTGLAVVGFSVKVQTYATPAIAGRAA